MRGRHRSKVPLLPLTNTVVLPGCRSFLAMRRDWRQLQILFLLGAATDINSTEYLASSIYDKDYQCTESRCCKISPFFKRSQFLVCKERHTIKQCLSYFNRASYCLRRLNDTTCTRFSDSTNVLKLVADWSEAIRTNRTSSLCTSGMCSV